MSKWQKLSIALLSSIAIFALSSGRAEAAKIFNGETHSPTAHRTICNAGTPVDFSAYPSNVTINLTTGVMSYNINVIWASCNGTPTRAYAVYSLGQEVCPISGTYGASDVDGGRVTDCVKYVGNPPYVGPGNGLTCSAGIFGLPGTNAQCVTQNFSGVRRNENQPSSSNSAVIPMQTVIPNWGTAADTGSYSIGNSMCQFYKTGANFNAISTDRCIDVSMTVSWKQQVVLPQISCGSTSTNPVRVEEGQSFDLTASFNLGGGAGQSGNTTYSIAVSVPSIGINNQAAASNVAIPWSGGSGSGTVSNISIANAGQYPVSYSVDVAGATNTPQTCSGSIRVVRVPYLSVYGADVKVGGAFLGGNCSQAADIKTYTNSGLGGSGVEFAAIALGSVTDFHSARLRSSAPVSPAGLTFANTGTPAGQFGGQNCVDDYFADGDAITPDSTSVINLSSLTSGSYKYSNPSTLTISGQVTGNNRVSLYVDGNLRITSNTTFANTSWATVNDIPSLRLYVKGNIYIESDVTQLDGVYVAQPNGANSGVITTCVVPGTDMPVADNRLADDCKLQLRINGAFIAQQVRFLRTANSLKDAGLNEMTANGSKAGEVFNYTPDIFMVSPQPAPGSQTDQTRYDSFTGLPPIL